MEEVAIKIEGVSKKYTVGKQKDSSLRGSLGGLFKNASKKGEDFWALKDVSFEVKKGEVIGIIGKNGAGKSTLLKILSKITKPTEGKIEINGRVASLLEVGTGFHPELTGRENIFLNGTILGMTRKEVKSKFDEIVAFSGVEKFIDTPVKHYSSGMYVRLAFAVAAHLDPEILIIDEVLAVGDAEFQKKCLGKMKDVAQQGRTVIFVSHNMGAMQTLCSSGVLLVNGKVKLHDTISAAIDSYLNNKSKELIWESDGLEKDVFFNFIKCELEGTQPNLKLNVKLEIQSDIEMTPSFIAFNISDGIGQIVAQSIPSLTPFIELKSSLKEYTFSIDIESFVPDNYSLGVWIGPHFSHTYCWNKDNLHFQIMDSPQLGRTYPHPRDHGTVAPKSIIIS